VINIKMDLREGGCEGGRWMELEMVLAILKRRILSQDARQLFCYLGTFLFWSCKRSFG